MAKSEQVKEVFKLECVAGFSSVSKRPSDINGNPEAGKYVVTGIISKDDPQVKALKTSIAKVANMAFKKKVSGLNYVALQDGDKEKSDRPGYANSYFISAKSANYPIKTYERVNGKFVECDEVRSGYKIVIKGVFASNEWNGKQQVLAWPTAVLVLEKTEADIDPDALFGGEYANYETKVVEDFDADTDESDLEDLEDEEWEEPEEVKPVAKKKKAVAAATSNGGAKADEGDDWDQL